ncbi:MULTISPECIES: bifunctional riboflavin kinase/FAD synthetase [unclassified Microbacterium]|uniref:bifunctional riboflavin kinase/FAD synthetase n=1 Tax=unclassified Microbacterium TaxID=2609290 RepID=UPI00097F114A|nr:bifunctional riboflavin kinase/FAD synthetase [Microbacterium sp. JB110]RCS58991.1 bifunctional riboflavin kinase/FAD synthetase [Microbacterium sp. JB110]SJM68076.1 Riboflavin kinase / FMN adenylyltransferase [Frigoribacterium sp. JB110]
MILFRGANEVPDGFGESIVAIGKFDGVHAGHRAIIDRMIVASAAGERRTVAVTFDRNPLAVLAPDRCPKPLVGTRQKAELLAATGIDATLMLTFDESLAREEAETFARRVLVDALRARHVLVGRDFRFGARGAGDAALLERLGAEHGFVVDVIDDIASEGERRRVSSTWVRELLTAGDVARAAKLLGRLPSVTGEVVHGFKRGRELGFPTANLSSESEGFVPADGVYAGWLVAARPELGNTRYPAAISVGANPTFSDVDESQVEAYVLDETELDLYGARVDVEFAHRIRGMEAFDGLDSLITQMRDDVARTRELLGT